MAQPQLKHQMSTLLHKISESDDAPSTQVLPLCKSIGDNNVQQPKASTDQNVPHHQKDTSEIPKGFMRAIVCTKTSGPIFSDDKYSMVEAVWKFANESQDHQWAMAGAPVGIPSVCQLTGGSSLTIDPQTRVAICLTLYLLPLYQI